MVSLVDLVTEEEEEAQAAHPIMLDPLVECVRAQTIECVNEVCMALAKYLRQTEKKENCPLSPFQGLFLGLRLNIQTATVLISCSAI